MMNLSDSPLLRGLPLDVVRDFLDRVSLMRVVPNGVVFREGEIADRIFLIVRGRVKVSRKGERGRDDILVIAGPGELLGGLPIFEAAPHKTSGVALGPAEVAWFSGDSMREWLERNNTAAMQFIRLLIERTSHQNDFLHDVVGLGVSTRVARAVLRDAHRFGRSTPLGLRVNLGLNQEELATRVRASRESVNHALSSFVKLGWIEREGSEILILDEHQLAGQAGETDEG